MRNGDSQRRSAKAPAVRDVIRHAAVAVSAAIGDWRLDDCQIE